MASKEKHIVQYQLNKKLIESKNLDMHKDWKITVLFYAGLHLLESTYADIFHSTTHEARKNFMESNRMYCEIKDVCDNLEMLSRRARYKCITIKDTQLEDAEDNLRSIENFVETVNR